LPRELVEDDLAVLTMDHLAPRSGRDLCPWKRVEGVLVDVVAAGTEAIDNALDAVWGIGCPDWFTIRVVDT
jgi:hypothetical protein